MHDFSPFHVIDTRPVGFGCKVRDFVKTLGSDPSLLIPPQYCTTVPTEPGRVHAEEAPGGDRELRQCNQILAYICTHVSCIFHSLNRLKTDLNCLFYLRPAKF